MIKKKIQIRDISAVAASRAAIINLPIGPRYHYIGLTIGDTGAGNGNAPTNSAIINEIRILMNGKIQRRITGTRLDTINTAMGAEFAMQTLVSGGANGTGRSLLPIFFNEPWRKRLADQDALAWQTGWLRDQQGRFQIECDLNAAITPVLTAFAITDNFDSGKPNGIMKWLTNDFNAVGTPVEISTLERKDLWSQITFFDTTGGQTVDRVRLVAGDLELHDVTRQENTAFLKHVDMNPAAGSYHVVFDHDDSLDDLIPAADMNSVQATLTLSAAAASTLTAVTQRVGLPT